MTRTVEEDDPEATEEPGSEGTNFGHGQETLHGLVAPTYWVIMRRGLEMRKAGSEITEGVGL